MITCGYPATTVVIPAPTEGRWNALLAAVTSVQRQRRAPAGIVVAVDHNPSLLRRISDEMPYVVALENQFTPSASGTRNSGALQADTPVIAFLDADVRAHDDGLGQITAPFAEPDVLATGGFGAPVSTTGRRAVKPHRVV
jgi:cellulose synthase/poly-beta-1,6-N-acetylglucosamine synthase-like glycosyltransferase